MRAALRGATAVVVGAGLVVAGLPAGAADGPAAPDWSAGERPASRDGVPAASFATGRSAVQHAPGPDDAPPAADDVVLVRFADGARTRERGAALRAAGLGAAAATDGADAVLVATGGRPVADVVADLAADDAVLAVQPNHVRAITGWTDDPLLEWAWPDYDLLRLPRAWDVATGSGVVVAVLDTGVDSTHPDLAGKVLPGRDLVDDDADASDPHGHGTAVAGIVAARADDGIGVPGAAWGARVLPVRVADEDGFATDADVAAGITWAVDHGAKVVNISLAGSQEAAVVRAAVADAVARGAVVVTAAGNEGSDVPMYPAAYAEGIDGLLSVGATDDLGLLTPFSSWDDSVTLAAPGVDVIAPVPGGEWVAITGTSAASPFVAGIAALVVGKVGLTPAQVERRLTATARDAGPRAIDPWYGSGVVDAAAALGLGAGLPFDRGPLGFIDGEGDRSGETPARAVPAMPSRPLMASLTPQGDEDWYRYDVPPGAYRVIVAHTGAGLDMTGMIDPVVEVREGRGSVLAVRDDRTGYGSVETVDVLLGGTGPLLVGVRNANGQAGDGARRSGSYEVTVTGSGVGPVQPSPHAAWFSDVDPTRHTAGVAPDTVIRVAVERELAAASVSSSTVRLREGATGAAVSAVVSYHADTRTITVTPRSPLVPGRHYGLVVDGVVGADDATPDRPLRTWFTVDGDGDRFTPLTPVRILDTRLGTREIPPGQVRPGSPIKLRTAEWSGFQVPDDATAVVLNVTAARPSGTGNIRVYPAADGSPPLVANLNVVAGVDQPNLVTVRRASIYDDVAVAVEGMSTHLVVDLAGYYSPGGATAYEPVNPVRVMDLRDGTGGVPRGALRAGRAVDLVVAGRNGVPADASAVVLNVTGVRPSARTNVRVYPAPAASEDQTPPTVSNLNLEPGRDQPNLVTVRVGDAGKVRFYTQSADVALVADLAGYYSPTGSHGFVPVEPQRIIDSRSATGLPGPLVPGVAQSAHVAGTAAVPADAAAVVVNVTAARPDALSNIRVFPTRTDGVVPTVSNLNVVRGRDEPNLAIVRTSADGRLSFYSQTARTHLVVDVSGYFRR
ncbi:S8 family serine peptidase [Cellulomonas carbonis]|uniref:Peptidase n=1 Tax=Cellulomonas carbonis T26 TaxID=947969 RepID=A0A0A0BRA5_9CELL|nr:S8 family serine peptidase [Cellulomonas carbonis]KGM10501.1 peptidase [Cellulomonas carbonis T26]GGC03295.1 hypothetical protein GCM10010972_15460 [Cellulomonas carbonis]